jgi:peptide/nickel transport system permease protein
MAMTAGSTQLEVAAVLEPTTEGERRIVGRSLGQLAWARLRKDKVAMAGGVIVILLLLISVAGWPLEHFGIIKPRESNLDLLDGTTSMPKGAFSGASLSHPLGVEPGSGRDILALVISGARVSMFISLAATVLAMTLGVSSASPPGTSGLGGLGHLRLMDLMLAFPVLLFSIALLVIFQNVGAIGPLQGQSLTITALVLIIGFFGFAYPARIMRGQVLRCGRRSSSRRRAAWARATAGSCSGAVAEPVRADPGLRNVDHSDHHPGRGGAVVPRRRHPAAGVVLGKMLSQAIPTAQVNPFYVIVPGMAIFITVLAFNLFGDGLRDAFDPKSSR